MISSVHKALVRLEDKGYVRSYMGGRSDVRGGRDKRLYTLTELVKSIERIARTPKFVVERNSKNCLGGRKVMKRQSHIERPPAWAIRFFSWYCNDHLADAALGDMTELHQRRCSTIGKRKADILFVWNLFLFFQPFAVRKDHDVITSTL